MADHTISISNSIVCAGPQPSLWGTMVWGVDKWGEGSSDYSTNVDKLLSDSLSVSDALTLVSDFNLTISNSLTGTFEMTEESLKDSSGYSYEFVRPTTDPELQVITAYTEVTAQTSSWAASSDPSTTWS